MRTASWIKLIGILTIIFGILGIVNDFLPYLISELSEKAGAITENPPDTSNCFMINNYAGLFVYSIYLLAGIFFLQKKPYSMWLMYFALTVSILYVLIPLFIFKLYQSIIFVLPGLFIDIALIIMVYRIRRFYFESPDEIVKAFGNNSQKPGLLRIFTVFGIICFSISLSILGLWIHAFNTAKTQGDPVVIFKSYFPGFLQTGYNTSYFSLFLCFLAIIFCSLGLKQQGLLGKLNLTILVLSSLLLFLNLFQLM